MVAAKLALLWSSELIVVVDAVRLMLPPAETPRLAMVIALEPDTAPVVRRAIVENVLGLSEALTVRAPEFDPLGSPILRVPVVNLANSAETTERLPACSVPTFIGVADRVGAIVTIPETALIEFEVLMANESALNRT
jgi:hypothetical protein